MRVELLLRITPWCWFTVFIASSIGRRKDEIVPERMACLANLSTASLPGLDLWPGIQMSLMVLRWFFVNLLMVCLQLTSSHPCLMKIEGFAILTMALCLSEKISIRSPMNKCRTTGRRKYVFLLSCCDMYYHLSEHWTLSFLATMNKCTELRKYAFPDPCLLDFFSCSGGYYHLSKYSTFLNILYIITFAIMVLEKFRQTGRMIVYMSFTNICNYRQ